MREKEREGERTCGGRWEREEVKGLEKGRINGKGIGGEMVMKDGGREGGGCEVQNRKRENKKGNK